jgi:hypothetical protein
MNSSVLFFSRIKPKLVVSLFIKIIILRFVAFLKKKNTEPLVSSSLAELTLLVQIWQDIVAMTTMGLGLKKKPYGGLEPPTL